MGSLDIHQRVMRLAILLDLIGEGFQPPIFRLADGAAIFLDDGLILLLQRVRLLRRNILARKEHMLIAWHEFAFPFQRCLGAKPLLSRIVLERLRKEDSKERRHRERR
jgi:hypothetical protein